MYDEAVRKYFKNALESEEYCEYYTCDIYSPISWEFLISVIVVVDSEEHGVKKYHCHYDIVEQSIAMVD